MITKREYLDKAKRGPHEWNTWTQHTCVDHLDFSDIDFNEEKINFSGFIFETRVSFKNSKFGAESCNFSTANFKKGADFKNCVFENDAIFTNTIFVNLTFFDDAQFKAKSNFSTSTFNNGLSFIGSQFHSSVNFSNLVLRELEFSKTQFFDEALFLGSKFVDSANFQNCVFHQASNFSNATFEKIALFAKTQFVKNAYFTHANFHGRAIFRAAEFRGDSDFSNISFSKESNFGYVQFGGLANFNNTIFTEIADFRATQFISHELLHENHKDSVINFSGAQFHSDALFNIGYWNSLKSIYNERYDERKKWAEYYGISAEKLASTDFRGAHFNESISFEGRKFIGPANFGPLETSKNAQITIFKKPPNFHECEFHQNTTFYRAEFPTPSGDDSAARAYRTLKLAFSKKQDIRQEQKFYKLEMLEELKSENFSKRWVAILFNCLSGFGFSIKRPLALMLISTILALNTYGLLSDLKLCDPTSADCDSFGKLLQFSLFAIPGFEKMSLDVAALLYPAGFNIWIIAILLIHKLAMLLGFFLLGLALRNLFKMK